LAGQFRAWMSTFARRLSTAEENDCSCSPFGTHAVLTVPVTGRDHTHRCDTARVHVAVDEAQATRRPASHLCTHVSVAPVSCCPGADVAADLVAVSRGMPTADDDAERLTRPAVFVGRPAFRRTPAPSDARGRVSGFLSKPTGRPDRGLRALRAAGAPR
jgi:hypothetical protein